MFFYIEVYLISVKSFKNFSGRGKKSLKYNILDYFKILIYFMIFKEEREIIFGKYFFLENVF